MQQFRDSVYVMMASYHWNMLQNMSEAEFKSCLRGDAYTKMYYAYVSSYFPNDGTNPRHLNPKDKKKKGQAVPVTGRGGP
jgi:hypothetical protein